jgi:D-alanyl-D-alanine carboxypeptidase (penicillin-binding protein 5/6)
VSACTGYSPRFWSPQRLSARLVAATAVVGLLAGVPVAANAAARTKPGATSTPHDLILLARYAMTSTNFQAVVAHQSYSMSRTSGHAAYSWTNTNLLLGSYSGAIGIKTGHTNAAGYSLVFTAKRGGRTLIGLVLNSTTTDTNRRFKDAAAMLDWGFGAKTSMLRMRSLPAGQATD